MALPHTFDGQTTPQMSELDDNFAALGRLTPLPCGITGTNAVTLTPEADNPTLAAYSNYIILTGVAAATNTGATTAQYAALAALLVYKDTIAGPTALTGGEIVANTKLMLMYDSTLNSGNGGFHLISPPSSAVRNHTTTSSVTLGAILPGTGSVVTILLGGTSVGDIITVGFPASPSIGLSWQGYVPGPGTVNLQVVNMLASVTITPTAGLYRVAAAGYS